MSSYSSLQNHRSMVFDELRNGFYAEAIKTAVKKDSVVLDLGAGLGLHGLMAAIGGAKKTYFVEPSPIIKITEILAEANSLSDKLSCIQNEIQEADLPEKVDTIISVFTGNFLLTEDLLPALFYARDKYLRPGGTLIPDQAKMEVVPVSAPDYYDKHISAWSKPINNIDYSTVQRFATNNLYYDNPESMQSTFLAEPVELLNMNFMTATEAACHNKIEVKITENGLCHGWLGWFQIHLGDKWLSTSPLQEQTHWRQVLLPLNKPIQVKTGENMTFELNRPEFGEWTWTVETSNTRQRQSTFLSEPLSPETLQKKSDHFKASLNSRGQAARSVLQRLNGKVTTETIAKDITKTYPTLFSNQGQAKRFIVKLIEDFC